jgi:ATP-binding cassette subfamily C protein LapB
MKLTSSMAWLRPLLEPLIPTFREVLVITFFVNVLALAAPVFVLQVYDRVVFHAGLSTLAGLVIGMVLVMAFDYVLRQARARIMQTVALRIDVEVGRRLFEKLTSLPLHVLESRPAAYWQSLFRDVDTVRNTVSGASAILIADLPFVVLFLGLVFVIAMPIAWVLLVMVPAFVFVAWRSANVLGAANQAERQTTLTREGMLAEMIAGRTTIKALALEGHLRPIWENLHASNIERAIVRGSKTDSYTNAGALLSIFTSVGLTTVGAIAIVNQALTIGALIATNMLSGRLIGPFNQLVNTWRTYAGFRQAVDRLGQVFALTSERERSEVRLARPKGELVLENVSFHYAEEAPPVVDNVHIGIRPGGVHAIVGRNGSGKTTLIKLMQGLYRPTSGRVLLDGADIAQFSRSEIASWIGYVPQECVLFAGTVRDNIANRKPDATDEEVVRAATAAGAHGFVIDLPDGYGTDIGEAGRRLSAGQRQRLTIARALIGDPPVLLLDEPSGSLDRQAEEELRATLVELGKERTIIIVTHSPVLLAGCQNLMALEKGRVAIAGPAKDLLPRLFGAGRRAGPEPAAPTTPAPAQPAPAAASPYPTRLAGKAALSAVPQPTEK